MGNNIYIALFGVGLILGTYLKGFDSKIQVVLKQIPLIQRLNYVPISSLLVVIGLLGMIMGW